jgi:alkaline phosphatase D
MTNLPGMDRRRLLQIAAACASAPWLARSARGQPRFSSNPFTLGVASGSPTHDSVVLWTRLALPGLFGSALGRDPVTVRWEVSNNEAFTQIVQSGQTQALAELAHSVHVELAGLAPDRWYFYRFMAGDAVSTIGRTRTFAAPDAPASRLRLAYASCQRWEHGYYGAYRHMLAEQLDLVLFLGDYIYEYPNAANAVRVPSGGWVLTLDDYRQRHALHRSDAALQAMHAACPWLVTWDDHEVQNDYAGLQPGDSGAAMPGFAARRAAAYKAFYEHMPVRAAALTKAFAGLASGAELRIYTSLRHGRLAHLSMLDARQYKDAQVCTTGDRPGSSIVNPSACPAWEDTKRSFLGAEQERWLDAGFASARGGPVWNVIGQQTLFGSSDHRLGAGKRLWNDGWDGYAAARKRLTDSLRSHSVANTVMLGGDVHQNWVGHVKADYADLKSEAIGVEFCGTSITSRTNENFNIAERIAENPHFVFADATRRGYGVVEFSADRLSTTLRVVDDVTRREPAIETQARFTVQAGRPILERD